METGRLLATGHGLIAEIILIRSTFLITSFTLALTCPWVQALGDRTSVSDENSCIPRSSLNDG